MIPVFWASLASVGLGFVYLAILAFMEAEATAKRLLPAFALIWGGGCAFVVNILWAVCERWLF